MTPAELDNLEAIAMSVMLGRCGVGDLERLQAEYVQAKEAEIASLKRRIKELEGQREELRDIAGEAIRSAQCG